MTDKPPRTHGEPKGADQGGDGWTVIAYLLSGLLAYGLAGWALDQWLGTKVLMPIGLILGGVASVYLVYIRYVKS